MKIDQLTESLFTRHNNTFNEPSSMILNINSAECSIMIKTRGQSRGLTPIRTKFYVTAFHKFVFRAKFFWSVNWLFGREKQIFLWLNFEQIRIGGMLSIKMSGWSMGLGSKLAKRLTK